MYAVRDFNVPFKKTKNSLLCNLPNSLNVFLMALSTSLLSCLPLSGRLKIISFSSFLLTFDLLICDMRLAIFINMVIETW